MGLIYNITMWLNAFPNKNGVSRKISPDGIILGKPKVDFNCIKLSFGAYAQVYENTTNKMEQKTVGDIALRPSNDHGTYYLMSLETGKKLNCYQWNELPKAAEVIDRVNFLSTKEKQQQRQDDMPLFEWEPRVRIENTEMKVDSNVESKITNNDETAKVSDEAINYEK